MTIEERTRLQEKSQFSKEELELLNKLHGINSPYGIGYYIGATEQQNIDIEKACEWWVDKLNSTEPVDFEKMDGRFRQSNEGRVICTLVELVSYLKNPKDCIVKKAVRIT